MDGLMADHQAQSVPQFADSLCIDLHCHDCNSDVPDELWGRILRVPETYLSTKQLLARLKQQRMDAVTITNHNNARSCWSLLEKGVDVVVGAEFTCFFPDTGIQVHVLVYGFTPSHEAMLNQLRSDIYRFLIYTADHDLPTVLAHPLYFHLGKKKVYEEEHLARLALLFERFEVLNGQRDVWQNYLTTKWLHSLTEEKIEEYSRKFHINPLEYNRNRLPKKFTGGSDDHMGLFAGNTGTRFVIDSQQRGQRSNSELVLEAMRWGRMTPFGTTSNHQRMQIALLDYLCQLGLNMRDPGLFRMVLHQGDLRDKLICLVASNAIQEMKRHKYTSGFLRIFHDSLAGVRPGLLSRLAINKDYRPIVSKLSHLLHERSLGADHLEKQMNQFIPFAFDHLMSVMVERVKSKIKPILSSHALAKVSFNDIIKKLEVPSHIRSLISPEESQTHLDDNITNIDLLNVFDQLSFPALFSSVIMASNLISTRIMFQNRVFLNRLTESIGAFQPPKRALWLTDTLFDKNGVSHVLQSILKEVQSRNLPIDFLICSDTIAPQDHLIVTPSLGKFHLFEFYQQQFNIPNVLKIFNIFHEGGYDRIICSTELMLGLVALCLRYSFHVPCYFYMHTDWMEFFSANADLDEQNTDRIRRLLRLFYHQFEGIFVLNSEHEQWLSSNGMGIESHKIMKTAHWVEDHFVPHPHQDGSWIPGREEGDSVLLYAGRINREKGVMELPSIYRKIREKIPHLKMMVAGSGPQEEELRKAMPEAIYLGWVKPDRLPMVYASADLLVLPSRFDTFGLVVLEALSCGLPVGAYDVKGPRDLISNGHHGITALDQNSLVEAMIGYFQDPGMMARYKDNAVEFSKKYDRDAILNRLLCDLGLADTPPESTEVDSCASFSSNEQNRGLINLGAAEPRYQQVQSEKSDQVSRSSNIENNHVASSLL